MERRGFLKSLVGGITTAGLLLKATPAEVQAFGVKLDQGVIVSPEKISFQRPQQNGVIWLQPGQTLYDANGDAVAIVENVSLSSDEIEVTNFLDANRRYISGHQHIRIIAAGLPPRR